MTNQLLDLPRRRAAGSRAGITSICTAHPMVIEAALARSHGHDLPVLIEATCNQVNQDGGYTGMTPADFRIFVESIAGRIGFDRTGLILGGDHLGPNPWKHLPAEQAMAKAETMVAAYAQAGFVKLHLDTSMGCAGEPTALPDEIAAERAARLAVAAERNAGDNRPVYVIGTEVPVPGGALEALDHLQPTRPQAVGRTVETHRVAFAAAGAEAAFERAIAVVVQPGVEFGNDEVAVYRPEAARDLSATLGAMPQFVFEAHSTDYQPEAALRLLVDDGFAILKVGPWLTFALREALYGLDQIAGILDPAYAPSSLQAAMERLMVREPGHWRKYYYGSDAAMRVQRHFSYSDRIRYYWPHAEARRAVEALMASLGDSELPPPLISQFLPALHPMATAGFVEPRPRPLLMAAISRVLDIYDAACGSAAMPP